MDSGGFKREGAGRQVCLEQKYDSVRDAKPGRTPFKKYFVIDDVKASETSRRLTSESVYTETSRVSVERCLVKIQKGRGVEE